MMALFHLLSAILLAIAPSAAYTLKTRITSLNRFRLRCKLDIDTTSDLAAQLEIPSSGIIPYIGKSVFDHNLTATTYPSFRNATGRELFITKFNLWKQLPWKKIKGKVTLKLKVGGSLDLDPSRGGFIGGGSRDPELVSSLPELFTLFQFAAYDPRITSILLEIDRLNVGYAALEEVKRMMSLFRQSGKQIVGYCSSGAEKELFLALQCDDFYIPPGGDLDLRGFSAAATFLRGIFDKVGIEPQVQRIGKYKSFGDTFNRTTISEAQREVLSSLLVESSEFWAHTVARALNQSVEAVRSIWAEVGVTTVEDWKQKGFITGVKYLDQVEALMALRQQSSSPSIPLSVRLSSLVNAEALEKYNEAVQNETQSILADVNDFELESDFLKYPRRSNSSHSEKVTNKSAAASIKSAVKRSSLLRYLPASIYLNKMRKGNEILRGLPVKEVRGGPRIAVINAAGGINSGKSSRGGPTGRTLGSDTLISMVRRARFDPSVKAVVLRIDSPGGSALASDLMWREIRLLSREKPVVASMVNVAASGGYYIAMACDCIFAEELTITGSIGVVTSKFNVGELNKRIGYGVETVSRGRYAEILSSSRGFSEEEEAFFAEGARNAYTAFTTKAAASRGMTLEQLQEVAQGRVWTGRQAFEKGLVDNIGGLWCALDVASKMAGLPATGDKNARRIEIFREPSTGLPLPFSLLLSLAKFFSPNKFNSAKNLAPQVVVDDVYSGFIGHESHVMRRYLKLIGLSEESVMNALFDLLE